jgi:hypothetical protein
VIRYINILLCFIFAFSLLNITIAIAGTGDLQVTCEPGVKIYVDGEYKGTSNTLDDGLALELSPGRHTLKAIKQGYEPFVKEFSIQEYKGTKIEVNFKDIGENIYQLHPESGETTAQVGMLELRSIPMDATVFVEGKRNREKLTWASRT